MKLISHPDLARLHPTAHHPETTRRIDVLLEAVGTWTEAIPATEAPVGSSTALMLAFALSSS